MVMWHNWTFPTYTTSLTVSTAAATGLLPFLFFFPPFLPMIELILRWSEDEI
jgi:hypothetical protein